MEAILGWLLENWPVLGVMIVLVIVLSFVVWKVSEVFHTKILKKSDIQSVAYELQRLMPCQHNMDIIKDLRDISSEYVRKQSENDTKLSEVDNKLSENDRKLSENDRKLSEVGNILSENIRKLSEVDNKLSENDRKLSEVDNKLSENDRKLSEVNNKLSENDRKLSENDRKLSENDRKLTEVDNKLEKIITFFSIESDRFRLVVSGKNSPRALTEEGKMLYNACGGKDFLESNKDFFMDMISAEKPQTAFDVEAKAYDVLFLNRDNSIFNPIKRWIYYSPDWKVGDYKFSLGLREICFVISLPLRDMYLEAHPEIQ